MYTLITGTLPLFCSSGETRTVEPITPTIILVPPEKLALEVRTTGRYFFTQWTRNGNPLDNQLPNYAHFGEIYFVENTGVQDLGAYEVTVVRAQNSDQTAVNINVLLTVVSPGMCMQVQS